MTLRIHRGAISIATVLGACAASAWAADPSEVRLDWATYNPVSIVRKDQGPLEKALLPRHVGVRWVQSRGSTAGSAALVARINGNPIKAIYTYSAPEWTAPVTRRGIGIRGPADLKGRRVAVTRGTDPDIFLIRALASVGLTEKDLSPVLLQHPAGRTALDRGDVDA